MKQELNFNEEIVTFLKEEEKDLRIKAKKCKENGDYPMYTKLINAYERIVELIKKYDWQLQYSEYRLDDKNGQKQVAVFEENGDGQIRNHKVWNIQEKNIVTDEEEIKIERNAEIQKRMVDYAIAYGMFYKYMFKAIEFEKINIIFYHDGCYKLRKFQNMIQEEKFKKLFNDKIEHIVITKERIEIYFKNGSNIKFVYASDNARGRRCHYAIVDTDISKEVYHNVVLPTCVNRIYKENNIEEINDICRVEFINFGC